MNQETVDLVLKLEHFSAVASISVDIDLEEVVKGRELRDRVDLEERTGSLGLEGKDMGVGT